jgi:ATP synthase protein I
MELKKEELLRKKVELQAKRMKKAEKDQPTLMSQTAYIGTLGLIFVLPLIAGAYFGRWLDSQLAGYSVRWTISMLFVGLVMGAINIYLFIRERA